MKNQRHTLSSWDTKLFYLFVFFGLRSFSHLLSRNKNLFIYHKPKNNHKHHQRKERHNDVIENQNATFKAKKGTTSTCLFSFAWPLRSYIEFQP